MGILTGLEPSRVFEYFERICSVPHGSGNTGMVSDLICGILSEAGIKHTRDSLNNIIAYKPASAGYEGHGAVILQGHTDMVCAKADGCGKDMAKEGLDLVVSDGYVSAQGTSLGGDDGIAVAMMLAVLTDASMKHPPIEAVFTVDEEVGMDGARSLDMSALSGRKMINLDSEEEGVFTVSCAGGVRLDGVIPANNSTEPICDKQEVCRITLDGLLGGHSGTEINRGRGNAIKLMARVLYWAARKYEGLRLISLTGGEFDNVICNSCEAVVSVDETAVSELEAFVVSCGQMLKTEFEGTDEGIRLTLKRETGLNRCEAFSVGDTLRFLRLLCVLPYGVRAMSRDMEGLVQTSSNVGVVRTKREGLTVTCSVRSSLESQKEAVAGIIEAACEQAGGRAGRRGDYPGWAFLKESPLRDVLCEAYREQSGREPVITAIHAGLECGMFAAALKGLDCVSMGPEMHDIHSADERLGIASVGRLYELVKLALERL